MYKELGSIPTGYFFTTVSSAHCEAYNLQTIRWFSFVYFILIACLSGELTVTLAEAEAGSRELGLQPGKGYTDYSLYEDENRRRCMKWLRSVQVGFQ